MRIDQITEKWSQKYKRSIDCSNPKGFSQKAHCAGRKKKTNEAFNNPYPIDWGGSDDPEGGRWVGNSKLGDGSLLTLEIAEIDPGQIQIDFYRKDKSNVDTMKATGQGDEFRVFATVQKGILEWWESIDQDEVHRIEFSASKESDDSKNRHKLYARFAKQWANKIGWVATTGQVDDAVHFVLMRPNAAKFAKDQDLEVMERELTKSEKSKMRKYEKKVPKADFIKRYGKKEGESIYYGTITNMAKKASKKESIEEGKRIPRKKGQPAGSKKHSDLYTDENPKGTIKGLKFATVADAKASVSKIRNSGKKHAHKIQAAVAMEQRAKAAGKTTAASVYRTYINAMKKKTKKKNESVGETKEAPPGHYFTKSGNLVKGTLSKDAKERGARQTDPKDKSRSKIPAVTQYNENYIKSIYTGNYLRKPDHLKGTTKFTKSAKPGGKESPHPARGMLVGSKMSEGVNDPHIFKAVFMAGGPGSGKSFVAKKLLGGTGLRPVNSDEVYEYLLKRSGLTLGPNDIASDKGQEIRGTAKDLTDKRQQNYIDGRLGLIIDGTGKVPELIQRLADKLKSIGYSVSMIFVNTSLEVAQQRNLERERTLPSKIVANSWNEVQQNLMKYQQIFGADRFHIIDNSGGLEDLDRQKNFDKVYNEVQRFINTPPKHKKALEWIQNQKAQNNAKQTTDSGKSNGGVTSTN